MDFEIIDVDVFNKPEDLSIINPHNRIPVMVERDLVLFDPNIINEYIDERFPHPQLMPPDPATRARARQLLLGMENEIFIHIHTLEDVSASDAKKKAARQHIRNRLIELVPLFNRSRFMMGDEFSMLDVAIAPLLWRLQLYEIDMPNSAAMIMKYAERLFTRQGFIDALTPSEKVMRR